MNERRSSEDSLIRVAVVQIGRAFLGKTLQLQDYPLALEEPKKQHEKVRPRVPEGKSMQWVLLQRAQIVDLAETMATAALERDDAARALQIANHLYAYSEVALQDGYQSRAFEYSLLVHNKISGYLLGKGSGDDSLWDEGTARLLLDIVTAKENHAFRAELAAHRAFIHGKVLKGLLGPEAREYFDPAALIPLDKV